MNIVIINPTTFGVVRKLEPITQHVADDMYQFGALATGLPLKTLETVSSLRVGSCEEGGVVGNLILSHQDAPEPQTYVLASGATVKGFRDENNPNYIVLQWLPERFREVAPGDTFVSDEDYLGDVERLAKEDHDYYLAAGGQHAWISDEPKPDDVSYWEPQPLDR